MLTIHKASAGSGKTFTLAYEYIKLLLGCKIEGGEYQLNKKAKSAHSSILAITFTNKATDEMKHRIIKELALLSKANNNSAYLNSLMGEFRTTAKEIEVAARDALRSLLNDFSNFNVSTIDSFFQNILRVFAREADVPYNYDIELRDSYAIAVGINDLLSSLNTQKRDSQLLSWLQQYMRNQIDNESSWNIFTEGEFDRGGSLHSLARNLSNEDFKQHYEQLEAYLEDKTRIAKFQKLLQDKIRENRTLIKELADECKLYIERLGIDFDYISKTGGLYGFSKIINSDSKEVELPASFANAINTPEKWFVKSKTKGLSLSADAIDRIGEFIQGVLNATKINKTYNLICENLYALGLLGDISSYVFKFRNENNLILLSDTNELLRRIINDDDTPFIYERVGIRLNHFLIDEFQDTSRLQWQNMKPLLSQSLGSDNDNLVIGDVKQSIYRFRNADPSLLQSQINIDFQGKIDKGTFSMDTNWRSARNIIEFNNQLFKSLAQNLQCTTVYDSVSQKVASKKDGYVEISFVEDSINQEWRDAVLDELPERIITMLNNGMRQKDIAILVNKHKEGAEIIKCLLEYNKRDANANINVISDESLLLKNSPAIRLIINQLKEINNSNTKNADILALHKEYEQAIELTNVYGSSLISITEFIISKISDDLRVTESAYIQAFQDVIIDFSARKIPTTYHFIKWWGENGDKLTINSPSSMDAINVMTIHKSKGLEFPVIIIPFCDWEFDSGRGLIWEQAKVADDIAAELIPPIVPIRYTKKLADTFYADEYNMVSHENIVDTLNKTYVAFTRAGEELLIYTPAKAKKGCISEQLGMMYNLPKYILGEQQNHNVTDGSAITSIPPEVISDYIVAEKLPKLHFKLPTLLEDNPREHGILLHKIFSLVDYADNIDSVVRQCQTNGLLKDENVDKLIEFIAKAINQSALTQSWFAHGNQILKERAVISNGKLKRPDRIVIDSDNNVTIIDYKFGSQYPEKYKQQVAEYISILRNAGFKNVTGYLWYPSENKPPIRII